MAAATKLLTSGGGGVILTPASNIAADVTVNIPSQNCTLGIQGPAFSAYLASNQTVSNSTWTKATINTKEFDTNSNYDNTTNYRFTPTVAGYYQVNAAAGFLTSNWTGAAIAIYKNGSIYKSGGQSSASIASGFENMTVSCLIYLNGSTDYIELYAYVTATTPAFAGGLTATYLQASMVRSA